MSEKNDDVKMEKTMEEEMKRQRAMAKELALSEVRNWIKTLPEEKRNQVVAAAGTKTFTPDELLKEIEADTEYGKDLVKMFNKLRIELSRKTEEK